MGDRGKIGEAVVDNEVSLTSHAAADESRGDSVEIFDLVSESMAGSLVSRSVLPEGLQIHVTQIVFDRNRILFHDVGNAGLGVGGLRELESGTVYVIPECDDVDTLSVLGDTVVLAVQDLIKRCVSHVFQSVDDHIEGSPLVMDCQALDVFTEDYLRPVEIADSYNVEEQRTARHPFVIIIESLFPSSDGECLAGESSKADVEVGDVLLVNLGYVSVNLGGGIEVGFVGLLCVWIPFAGEDRLDLVAEGSVESHADSAYSRE